MKKNRQREEKEMMANVKIKTVRGSENRKIVSQKEWQSAGLGALSRQIQGSVKRMPHLN